MAGVIKVGRQVSCGRFISRHALGSVKILRIFHMGLHTVNGQ
jgi:hypothetical protein